MTRLAAPLLLALFLCLAAPAGAQGHARPPAPPPAGADQVKVPALPTAPADLQSNPAARARYVEDLKTYLANARKQDQAWAQHEAAISHRHGGAPGRAVATRETRVLADARRELARRVREAERLLAQLPAQLLPAADG